MKQLDLTAAPARPQDPAAPRLLHVRDAARGVQYTVAIGPESPWHEMLPAQQSVEVQRHAPARTEPAPAA